MISPKRKIAIIAVSFALLYSALTIFAILPLVKQIEKDSQKVASKEVIVGVLERQLDSLVDFQKKQSEYQSYLEQAESSFVRADAPIIFMEFLEAQAHLVDVFLSVSSITQRKGEEFGLGLNLKLAGPFARCLRFLEKIEQSPFLIEITNMQARRLTEKDIDKSEEFGRLAPGDVEIIISLRTLIRQAPQPKKEESKDKKT